MTKQVINIGRTANDRSGDPLRTAFNKVNENFTEIYNALTDGVNFAQVNADWNAVSGVARILNKPTIPTNTNQLTNGAGFITAADIPEPVDLSGYALTSDVPADVSDLTDLTGLLNVANRLNSGFNNLEMALDELGTLNLDTLFPVVFTATVDAAHYAGEGSLTLEGNAWSFAINFAVVQNGTISINITNNTPWTSNPGYENNMPFAFTEADHGISGYTFTLTLVDIYNPGPYIYTTNLAASQAPALPSTFKSNNAVKLTAGLSSWAFGTNGNLTLPLGGDILNSAGQSVLGGGANLGDLKITSSTIGTKDFPDTGGWGGYNLNLDPGGESFSYIQIPSVAGQTTGATLVIANNNPGNGGIRLSVQGGNLIFTDTGLEVPYNLPVRQNNTWTKVTTPLVNIGAGTVVWTSEVNYISSAKLIIQVECSEVGDASGWHSQACEAIIACRGFAGSGPTGDPQMIVYGVVHTSVDPLVTFTVRRNPTTLMVEVVGTLTAAAAGAADLRIHSVEMSTRD